jgi:Short C-terminal domain/Phospholipase_D-nuclease N-terminal
MLGFGNGEVLYSLLWFTIFFIWIWLLLIVFSDIFRSHDMGGVAKFLWVAFIIFFPYLGVFIYLIARGGKMGQHAAADAAAADAATREYIQNVVGSGSPSEELAKLADLKAKGVIDDAEFNKLKAQVVGS